MEEGYTNFSTTKAYNLEQAMVEKHQKVNRRQRKVQEKCEVYKDVYRERLRTM